MACATVKLLSLEDIEKICVAGQFEYLLTMLKVIDSTNPTRCVGLCLYIQYYLSKSIPWVSKILSLNCSKVGSPIIQRYLKGEFLPMQEIQNEISTCKVRKLVYWVTKDNTELNKVILNAILKRLLPEEYHEVGLNKITSGMQSVELCQHVYDDYSHGTEIVQKEAEFAPIVAHWKDLDNQNPIVVLRSGQEVRKFLIKRMHQKGWSSNYSLMVGIVDHKIAEATGRTNVAFLPHTGLYPSVGM